MELAYWYWGFEEILDSQNHGESSLKVIASGRWSLSNSVDWIQSFKIYGIIPPFVWSREDVYPYRIQNLRSAHRISLFFGLWTH